MVTPLYLMPTEGNMRDFASARVNRAIAESDYLVSRVREYPTPRGVTDRSGLKRIGDGYVYMRGSDSARQLSSVDADIVLLDEFDLMNAEVLPLALQRIGSSRARLVRVASTPRFPEAGINALFLQSDQRHYFLPCPKCGLNQRLSWPENIDMERAMLVCAKSACRAPLDLWAEGEWIASAPGNSRYRGYHLSRLYSPMADIEAMIREADSTYLQDEQQFFNQVLGEVYVPPGGGLTIDDLDKNRQEYDFADYGGQECLMGVDVGKRLHVIIRETHTYSFSKGGRLWFAGEVDSFEDLDPLFKKFNVEACVVDSAPEGHGARQFADRHRRAVYLASYTRHQPGHEATRAYGKMPGFFRINRTEALDELTDLAKRVKLPLPSSARQLGGRMEQGVGEYYREMTASKRTLESDDEGNWEARWLKPGRPDHYAHAELYCMMAAASPARNYLMTWGEHGFVLWGKKGPVYMGG